MALSLDLIDRFHQIRIQNHNEDKFLNPTRERLTPPFWSIPMKKLVTFQAHAFKSPPPSPPLKIATLGEPSP